MPFCSNCGKETQIDNRFCIYCGHDLSKPTMQGDEPPRQEVSRQVDYGVPPEPPSTTERRSFSASFSQKSTEVAAALAAIPGLFGVFGLGHLYVGKIGRGVGLLISGLILTAISVYLIFLLFFAGIFGGGIIIALIGFSLIEIILWIWQMFDAHTLAKQFNKRIEETGSAPW